MHIFVICQLSSVEKKLEGAINALIGALRMKSE